MVTDQHLAKFQDLYHKHYGVELTKDEAKLEAGSLMRLVRAVLKPKYDHENEPIYETNNPGKP